MKHIKMVVSMLVCVASAAGAQGRGGRQGGPGVPPGPLCYNRGDAAVQTTDRTVNVNGVDLPTSVVVLTGHPGVRELLHPCPAAFGGADPLSAYFFQPDLIMAHQQAINLTDAQLGTMRTLLVDSQKSFLPVQLRLSAEVERLQNLVNTSPVDETAVLAQVDRVLDLERSIKRDQLSLMVRLKNLLTEPQQAFLAKLRPGD